MSRITISIAESVTTKLMEKRKKQVEEAANDCRKVTEDVYLKYVPKELKILKKDIKPFVKHNTYVYLIGRGLSAGKSYHTINSVATKNDSTALGNEDADTVERFHSRWQDALKKYREDFGKVKVTLINLRTYSNVEKSFPEAFQLLPNKTTTAVAVNVDEARKLI